jgi:two-component system response regulator RegX3
MQQVLIVDADRVAARMLGSILAELSLESMIVGSARAALEALQTTTFDLALLETQLPDGAGCELALELRARRYRGLMVFVSAQASLAELLRGYAVGADDYIVKPYDPAIMLAKLTVLVRRWAAMDAQPLGARLRVGDAALDLGTLTYTSAVAPSVVVTPTELRLLECLMRNPEVVISRETLLERGWGQASDVDSNTVDVYIRRLRQKLEVDPCQPTYLQTVRGLGYVFRPPSMSLPGETVAALLAA